MTRKQADNCRLRDYSEALATQDHLIFSPSVLESFRPQLEEPAPLNQLAVAEAPQPIPIVVLPEDDVTNELGGIRDAKHRSPDNGTVGEEKFGRLLVTNDADSCSDASSCNYQTDQYQRTPRRPTPRDMGDNSSDSEGNGGDDDVFNDGGGVYDSDLESDTSDPGRLSHEKKMRKWRSLARSRFEKMLLACIVNTGELVPLLHWTTYCHLTNTSNQTALQRIIGTFTSREKPLTNLNMSRPCP
jgi:hypothetical protein